MNFTISIYFWRKIKSNNHRNLRRWRHHLKPWKQQAIERYKMKAKSTIISSSKFHEFYKFSVVPVIYLSIVCQIRKICTRQNFFRFWEVVGSFHWVNNERYKNRKSFYWPVKSSKGMNVLICLNGFVPTTTNSEGQYPRIHHGSYCIQTYSRN